MVVSWFVIVRHFYYVTTTFFQAPRKSILNNISNSLFTCTTYVNTIQLLWVLGAHFWIFFLWYVCIIYWNNVTSSFRFCSAFLRIFHHVKFTLFLCSMSLHFFDNVRITSYFGTFELCMENNQKMRKKYVIIT